MRIKYTKTVEQQKFYGIHFDDSTGRILSITEDELYEFINAVIGQTGSNLSDDEIIKEIRINS